MLYPTELRAHSADCTETERADEAARERASRRGMIGDLNADGVDLPLKHTVLVCGITDAAAPIVLRNPQSVSEPIAETAASKPRLKHRVVDQLCVRQVSQYLIVPVGLRSHPATHNIDLVEHMQQLMLHDDGKELTTKVVIGLRAIAVQHVNRDGRVKEDISALKLPGRNGSTRADLTPLLRQVRET